MKKLAFGCMRLPTINNSYKDIDYDRFKKMIDTFIDNGFTYFDTAYPYHEGMSEIAVRECLVKRYPRDKYILATKLPIFHIKEKNEIDRIFNEQLEKLGVEYIDIYLVHALNRNTYELSKKLEVFNYFKELKQNGKIKHIAISFHDSSDILETILKEQESIEFVQLQINYIDWENSVIQSKKCYEIARKYNKRVLIMEPVKGGFLVNLPKEAIDIFKSVNEKASTASWAIRYCASLDGVYTVLSGMSNQEQIEDNISYMKDFVPLNDNEFEAIKKVISILNSKTAVACTKCRYCVEGCPKKIAIPDYFSIYNEGLITNNFNKEAYLKLLSEGNGGASDCIECGLCETSCPQHIKIRDLMKKVSEKLDN